MKKLSYIAIVIAFLSISCEKQLETAPTDAISDSEIYKNTENIETVINGTWKYLNDTYFTFANPGYSAVMRTSDAMGSDVAVTTKYGYRDPYAFTDLQNKTATRVRAFWTLFYKVIDNSNNVIAKVDQAIGNQKTKNKLLGQAKTLRAFAYLNLATFYQFSYLKDKSAKSVPIYLEPTNINSKGKPKATLEELYNVIIKDLTEASSLLSDYERPDNQKFKISTAVSQGLLARAYLNIGEWDKAAQAAKNAKLGFPLMDEKGYNEGFNDLQNPEWIWGHVQTPEQSVASYTFHFLDVSSSGSYYYSFMADPYFKEFFKPGDIRYKLFSWDSQPGREGFLRYDKFRFKSKTTLIGDILYMRAAEMYLIEAEANARTGKTADAIKVLNELRGARKAELFQASSGKDLISEILIERRKELWGEGFALSDILRTQSKVERKAFLNADGTPIKVSITTQDGQTKLVNGLGHRVVKFPDGTAFVKNSPFYLFSIPRDEENQNPNL